MSKYTAIVRKKPSNPASFLHENGLLVGECLDYGCGRGFDRDFYSMDGYDPLWFPHFPSKKYDTIMCNFVLNVVSVEEQEDIIGIVKTLLKENGKAYFTVRRDIRDDRIVIGRGCIQRYVKLDLTSLKHVKGRYEIYVYGSLV